MSRPASWTATGGCRGGPWEDRHGHSPLFGLYGAVDRRLVRAADALLANGDYGAQRLNEAYGRDAVVIPHGVDFTEPDEGEIAAIRARYDLPDGAPVLLTVNQLHPRKRIDLFIRVLAAVRVSHPSTVGLSPVVAWTKRACARKRRAAA